MNFFSKKHACLHSYSMDTMYERSKIQDESMYYKHKKHDGSLPLIGVNTFLAGKDSHVEGGELELMRSTDDEKDQQIENVETNRDEHTQQASPELVKLQQVAPEKYVETSVLCVCGNSN